MIAPHLQEYTRDFDLVKRNTRVLTVGITNEQFNWRPVPGRWSVAECIEHCSLIAEQTLPKVRQAIRHAREFGPFASGPFTYGFTNRLFIKSVSPEGPAVPTMSSYRPSSGNFDRNGTVNRFIDLQDEWIAAVRASEGLDLRRIRVPSPAVPLLRLSLGAWYEATPLHELRHLEQAHRVMQAPGFPSG